MSIPKEVWNAVSDGAPKLTEQHRRSEPSPRAFMLSRREQNSFVASLVYVR
jgi:hypothetical protein